ncbi:DUF2399 domain-containing protein [Lactobacillus sp.]|uniref:DUF2399 domain-containing protein n=1 Tax=Lactobacillus sp. TaxID=1591 RepID=UPI003EF29D2F
MNDQPKQMFIDWTLLMLDWQALIKDEYIKKGENGIIKNWRLPLKKSDLLDLGLLTNAKFNPETDTYTIPCYRIFSQYGKTANQVYQDLEARFGPLVSNKDRRKQKTSTDLEKLENFLSSIQPDYASFLRENVAKKTLLGDLAFYRQMALAWTMPEEPILLPSFALKILGDPHGLDRGSKGRSLLEKIIKFKLGEDANLPDYNIYPDQLYNFAMTANLLKTPLTYDIIALPDIDKITWPERISIYLHENSGVTSALAAKYPDRAFICTGGQVNLATKKLIKQLLKNHCQLFYSGDLDQSGVKIADNLLSEFPQIRLLNMDYITYQRFYDKSVPPVKDKKINEVANPVLATLLKEIQSKKRVIFEESIHDFL